MEDAKPKDIGFEKPKAALHANREVGENDWEDLGPADLSCLGGTSTDAATTVGITVTTTVEDFQSGNPVPGSTVTVFRGQDVNDMIAGPVTSDQNAGITFTLPVGVKRFGYKMKSDSALDTLLLNQIVDPNNPTQNVSPIASVSKVTAQTLTSFIGVSRTDGTGVLAGALRDCQKREISNFIATVSTTKGTATPAAGADTYYFTEASGLPGRHTQQASSSGNGLFMVIELQPATKAYVQMWGYKTDADLASNNLSLIAELEAPVIADTVITGSYEPLRQ